MRSAAERANKVLSNFDWYSLPEQDHRYFEGIAYSKCGCWEQMVAYGDSGRCAAHEEKARIEAEEWRRQTAEYEEKHKGRLEAERRANLAKDIQKKHINDNKFVPIIGTPVVPVERIPNLTEDELTERVNKKMGEPSEECLEYMDSLIQHKKRVDARLERRPRSSSPLILEEV